MIPKEIVFDLTSVLYNLKSRQQANTKRSLIALRRVTRA